ncbi:hypothetical protein IE077_003937, partial [Cardiosporidium cionae]
ERNFRSTSHEESIFLYALEDSLLLIELLKKLGGATKVSVSNVKTGQKIDLDDIHTDDEEEENISAVHGRLKTLTVKDIIGNFVDGKIVYNCMKLLSKYKVNEIATTATLIYFLTLLKDYAPHVVCIFFDLKYFLVFRNILNDKSLSKSSSLSTCLVDFAESILDVFFNLWESNSFLPIELFFGKHGTSAFTPSSEEYLRSIWTNYEEGQDSFFLTRVKEGMHLVDIQNEIRAQRRKKKTSWTTEKDEDLLRLFEIFQEDEEYLKKLSQIIGRSKQSIYQRLLELQRIQRTDSEEGDEEGKFSSAEAAIYSQHFISLAKAILNFKLLYTTQSEEWKSLYSEHLLLREIQNNFQDVFDTRRILGETSSLQNSDNALQVEDASSLPLEWLDFYEYKEVMKACGAHQTQDQAQWRIPTQISQTELQQRISLFGKLIEETVEALILHLAEEEKKEKQRTLKHSTLTKSKATFSFSSQSVAKAVLAEAMDVLQILISKATEANGWPFGTSALEELSKNEDIHYLLKTLGAIPPTEVMSVWTFHSPLQWEILKDRKNVLEAFIAMPHSELHVLLHETHTQPQEGWM